MALKDIADEYFSNLNSIASRISTDLNETKASYEDLWSSLTEEEKKQLMNETIIKPEICLKYSKSQTNNKKKNEYAMKLVVDDNCSYRDEHSGPFSFRTPSQRNLTIFSGSEKSRNRTPVENKNKESKMPVLLQIKTEENISESGNHETMLLNMPKTGLDLLDNW